LLGKGVSHCASCDGPLYSGRTVGVVGGGDSALQEALTLTNYAERILIFDAAEHFSAQNVFRERTLRNAKIKPHHATAVEEILGDEGVSGVRVRDLATDEVSRIDLAGVFVYIGMTPNTTLLRNLLNLSGTGHVPTDGWMKTEREGLYAVGDIRQDSAAQAITSAGDGATAAIAAYRYIQTAFPK
jgi:thioredoxin reductase (NADPH)